MEKLRLIQCGVGGFGAAWVRHHVPSSPDFELAAIVDISPEAMQKAGDEGGVPSERRFASLEDALKTIRADAVLTVTPPAVHVQHARVTFNAGLHLLTEKPIADSLENAKLMVQLARAAGKQLVVSQNYRFKPFAFVLRQLLQEKTLGEFGHGHLNFHIAADFTGSFRQTMEFPLLTDMAIHHLDLIRAITGRNIAKVTAQSFNPPGSPYQHDAGLKMLLELDGGIPFSYNGDWSAHGRFSAWDGDWRLQCAGGAILWENDKVVLSRSGTFRRDLSEEFIQPVVPPLCEQARVLRDFAQSIRTGQLAETSGEDNLHSFSVVCAAVESAKIRRAVAVRDLIG
jgi:predicted dehydrogenase